MKSREQKSQRVENKSREEERKRKSRKKKDTGARNVRKVAANTPPKFNIDPQKWWLEDYFPIGKVPFQGLC